MLAAAVVWLEIFPTLVGCLWARTSEFMASSSHLRCMDEMISATRGISEEQMQRALQLSRSNTAFSNRQSWHRQWFGGGTNLSERLELAAKATDEANRKAKASALFETYQPRGIEINAKGTEFVVRDSESAQQTVTRRNKAARRPSVEFKDERHLGKYPERLWIDILKR